MTKIHIIVLREEIVKGKFCLNFSIRWQIEEVAGFYLPFLLKLIDSKSINSVNLSFPKKFPIMTPKKKKADNHIRITLSITLSNHNLEFRPQN